MSVNSRNIEDALKDLAASGMEVAIAAADVSDEQALRGAIANLQQTHGTAEVLVYNVVSPTLGKPTTLTPS